MDKVSYYARARKVAVGRITQIVDGNFRSYWVGKLRGMIVSRDDGEYRFETEEDARAAAAQFRERCRAALRARREPAAAHQESGVADDPFTDDDGRAPEMRCVDGTERMARAIYERIVYAGEDVETVLRDYLQDKEPAMADTTSPDPHADGVVCAATLDDAAADPVLTLDAARGLLRDAAAGIRYLYARAAAHTEPAEGREADGVRDALVRARGCWCSVPAADRSCCRRWRAVAELRAEVQRLQAALSRWLPRVRPGDEQAADNAMLLAGYEGDIGDERG